MTTAEKYRQAARQLWPAVSKHEAKVYIKEPHEDTGKWCRDGGLATIYLEADMRTQGDNAIIPTMLDYYGNGFENCLQLSNEVGDGTFIEYYNAAVAVVYPG